MDLKRLIEVFWHFLALGCVSFGGPAAHMGYFQKAFVEKRQWLDQAAYARLIALSQFLPGPGSSQVGFALGMRRAGVAGGVAAFLGFTLPSFVLMYLLAVASGSLTEGYLEGAVKGLKWLAVVVVADASWTMFSNFCRTRLTMALAIGSAIIMLCFPALLIQMLVLVVAALVAWRYASVEVKSPQTAAAGVWLNHRSKWVLAAFTGIGGALVGFGSTHDLLALLRDFYISGSLVFGGGHVVLPLLQETVGDALTADQFLLGYAGAQAVPGPMFSLASFLGAELLVEQPLTGALLATLAIFLPGFLLLIALHDGWETLAARPAVARAVVGVNAAVVGLLLSALYSPVFVSAVAAPWHMALVIAGLFALRVLKLPVIGLVVAFVLAGLALS